tara:strand:- start:928 stop:1449 length:522 start_codon:yes stop_codon:yes gene_type:complete
MKIYDLYCYIKNIIYNHIIFTILTFSFYSCLFFPFKGKILYDDNALVFYLGKANTKNFQLTCEEILPFYGFYIDSYQNDQLLSKVITKWKVREPFESEIKTGFLETKIRLTIKGEVISNSYTRNNGYTYNCFLLYENVGFANNGYVLINDSPELKTELKAVIDHFREKYNYSM